MLQPLCCSTRFRTRIVNRAPFTDQVMRVQRAVQETLIDPLREAEADSNSAYPNVGHMVARPLRL
jgi:hypothetical protein